MKRCGAKAWAESCGPCMAAVSTMRRNTGLAPQTLPASLHWFYWEAYSTFLSGFFLLCLLYYAQAEVYLIDPRVSALSKPAAIAIGLGFLIGGWLVYDALCRTPLARPRRLARRGAGTVARLRRLCLVSFVQRPRRLHPVRCHVGHHHGGERSSSSSFPVSGEMVRAKEQGREPDPQAGIRGKLRSVHNTYFTLPVLFTMISNHYALTFGARYNWLVLISISAAGVLIRAWFVSRHKSHERGGRTSPWPALLGLCIIAATAAALVPKQPSTAGTAPSPAMQFAAARDIVTRRCVPCHAAQPSQPGFSTAPNGVLLDTPADLLARAALIEPQVATRAMPIGNLTAMTEPEAHPTARLDTAWHTSLIQSTPEDLPRATDAGRRTRAGPAARVSPCSSS